MIAGKSTLVVAVTLVVVVVVVAVRKADGQSCVPFTGSPLAGGKCDRLVTYAGVLLLPGQSYRQVDAATAATTKKLGAFLPPECRNAGLRLACLGGFVSCWLDPVLGKFNVLLPCQDVCQEMVAACGAFFAAEGLSSLIPNCSAVDPGTGVPLFPPVSCNNASYGVVVPYSQVDCPYPLKYNPDGTVIDPSGSLTSSDQICVYPCPDPMFSESDWDAVSSCLIALTMISFAMVLFLIITYSLMPQKRRFPTNFQIWLSVSSLITSFGVLLSVLVGGYKRTICTWDDAPVLITWDNASDNDGQGVLCVIQGILIMFGGLAGSAWWLMLTVTAFQFIVLRIRALWFRKVLHIFSHIVGWGLPITAAIIGLAGNKYMAATVSPNCVVGDEWEWGLWYGPVLFNLVVGTTMMAIVIIKILWVRTRLREFHQSAISAEHIIRLAGLIIGYWFLYAWFSGYRSYLEAISGDVTTAVGQQIACSAATGEDCELSERINMGAWFLESFTLGGQGIIIFCSLGLSKETYLFWRELLANWRDPMSVIRGGSSTGDTGSQVKGWKMTSSLGGSSLSVSNAEES